MEDKIKEILRDGDSDAEHLYWCGCYEGDINDKYPSRVISAVAELKSLIESEANRKTKEELLEICKFSDKNYEPRLMDKKSANVVRAFDSFVQERIDAINHKLKELGE